MPFEWLVRLLIPFDGVWELSAELPLIRDLAYFEDYVIFKGVYQAVDQFQICNHWDSKLDSFSSYQVSICNCLRDDSIRVGGVENKIYFSFSKIIQNIRFLSFTYFVDFLASNPILRQCLGCVIRRENPVAVVHYFLGNTDCSFLLASNAY